MIKLMLHMLILVILYSASLSIEAQTLFGSLGNNTNKNTQAPQTKFQPTIPSTQEYKSAVEARYQQYQQEIANQLRKQLTQPPTTSTKTPGTTVSGGSASPPLPTTNPPIVTPGTIPPLPSTPPTVAPPAPTYSTVAPAAEPPPKQTPEEPIYSGFQGTGSKTTPKSSNTSSGGGGWNINY